MNLQEKLKLDRQINEIIDAIENMQSVLKRVQEISDKLNGNEKAAITVGLDIASGKLEATAVSHGEYLGLKLARLRDEVK